MSLTTLLVLYTLFNQVSQALPDTAYIKMVDVWFFFCIFLIFFLIVVHILAENLPAGSPDRVAPAPPPAALAASGKGNKLVMVGPVTRVEHALNTTKGNDTR